MLMGCFLRVVKKGTVVNIHRSIEIKVLPLDNNQS